MNKSKDINKKFGLPAGCYILERKEVNPNEVVKLFSSLICILSPKQAKIVKKIQKEYADENGISIYQ